MSFLRDARFIWPASAPVRLAAVAILMLLVPSVAVAQAGMDAEPFTPAALVALPAESDGETIVMQGEAIGESLRSDNEHRWVNLLGDGTAVGVYMTNADAETITHYGRPGSFGDSVRVAGTLNRWCTQHAGEFDVHATEVLIVSEGQNRDLPVQPWKGVAGVVLGLVGFVEYRYFRYRRELRAT